MITQRPTSLSFGNNSSCKQPKYMQIRSLTQKQAKVKHLQSAVRVAGVDHLFSSYVFTQKPRPEWFGNSLSQLARGSAAP